VLPQAARFRFACCHDDSSFKPWTICKRFTICCGIGTDNLRRLSERICGGDNALAAATPAALTGENMKKSIVSHLLFGSATALLASGATYLAMTSQAPSSFWLSEAAAQTPPAGGATRQIDLFKTTMDDVLGRVVTIRRTEREPGGASPAHRHPGSHTFGYILEGSYEVKINDGPLRKLGPGDTFYEPPGALHAVSRNGSATEVVKYLVIQVSDPTKPATVNE
jgi:quercetin dioxygenase-like cupin family protein